MSKFSSTWPLFDPCDAVAMVAALDKSSVVSSEEHNHLAVEIDKDPLTGDGYGFMLHKEHASLADKKLFETVPTRRVITSISTDKIKKCIEFSLL